MAAISFMLPAAAPAQTSRAGVVTTLKGTATVARTTAPEPAPLKFKDDVFVHDRITTGDESIARILLGGKAVVTIRERSQLTITETAMTSTIEIASGKIGLSVDKTRVRPGESVEIKTPNAVAAIRGTIIIAEVSPATVQSPDASTRFTLLTGVVDVTLLDPVTGRTAGPAVIMKPMQALGVTGFNALGTPRAITRTEANAVASSYSVPLKEPSPAVNARIVNDQVQEASRRATGLTNDGGRDTSDRAGKDAVQDNSKAKDDGGAASSSTAGGSSNAGGSNGSGGGTTGGNSGNAGGNSGSNAGSGSGIAGGSGSTTGGNSGNAGGNTGSGGSGNGGSGNGGSRVVAGGGGVGSGAGGRVGGGIGGGIGGGGGFGSGGNGGIGTGGVIGGDDLRVRDKDRRGRDRSR